MEHKKLKQLRSMVLELEEEKNRESQFAAYSLFQTDDARQEQRIDAIRHMAREIEQIPDAVVRRALKLRYIDGLTWLGVSMRLGYQSEDGARKLCDRYLSYKC